VNLQTETLPGRLQDSACVLLIVPGNPQDFSDPQPAVWQKQDRWVRNIADNWFGTAT